MKKNIGFLLEYSTVSGKLNCQEDYNKNGGIYSYGDEMVKLDVGSTSGDITIAFYE